MGAVERADFGLIDLLENRNNALNPHSCRVDDLIFVLFSIGIAEHMLCCAPQSTLSMLTIILYGDVKIDRNTVFALTLYNTYVFSIAPLDR